MKPLFKIYLCLFASLCFIAACDDSDEEGISGFTINAQEFTLGATGGMESVKVASGTKWVAKVNQPWVKVMPANGVGSTNCEIVVDSTLSNDVRHAVVTFVPEGQSKQELKIHQTGYAESEDGKYWTKPVLDIWNQTNIVDTCNRDAATIWLDKQEKDPSKRYKMFNVERRPTDRRWQFILKYSSDGIHWGEGVAQSGDLYDRSSAFYNPFRDVWALSMRYGTTVSSRSRSYLENKDPEMAVSFAHRIRKGVPDKNMVYWFTPSDKEPRHPEFPEVEPGIYNFDAIAYESIMLGLYSVWQGPENGVCAKLGIQKKNEIFLGYSRDGFHFYRPSFKPFMAVNETEGAWNWGNMQSINGVPLIVGDSLYFYSSGRQRNKIMWDSYTSTGLATLRRDGFVSMHGDKDGYLLTEKVRFDGKHLFINADVKGSLAVEILDENGKPLEGFTRKDCVPMKKTDKTKLLVTWKKHQNIASLIGKAVRLKFYLDNADIYAFWISPWQTGESRGYTSGGGPGLSTCGIDVPANK